MSPRMLAVTGLVSLVLSMASLAWLVPAWRFGIVLLAATIAGVALIAVLGRLLRRLLQQFLNWLEMSLGDTGAVADAEPEPPLEEGDERARTDG